MGKNYDTNSAENAKGPLKSEFSYSAFSCPFSLSFSCCKGVRAAGEGGRSKRWNGALDRNRGVGSGCADSSTLWSVPNSTGGYASLHTIAHKHILQMRMWQRVASLFFSTVTSHASTHRIVAHSILPLLLSLFRFLSLSLSLFWSLSLPLVTSLFSVCVARHIVEVRFCLHPQSQKLWHAESRRLHRTIRRKSVRFLRLAALGREIFKFGLLSDLVDYKFVDKGRF